MKACDRTNPYFEQITDHVHNFFAAEDWQTTARTNYSAQKDTADQQWAYFLQTADQGAYFNAGMFYGRTYMLLSTGSFTYFNAIAKPIETLEDSYNIECKDDESAFPRGCTVNDDCWEGNICDPQI